MITFENASILGYSHNPKFFGEDIFLYSIEKKIKIQGYLLDLTNLSGVSGVFSGINQLKNLAKSSGEFYINNEYFGTGYITDIQIDGEKNDPNWVRYANYTADLTVLSTGSLYNMTGNFFNIDGSKFNVENLYRLNDFSENFSVNLNNDGIYQYNHNLNLGFENGLISSPVAASIAKNIASGIFTNQVPFKILSQYNNFLSGRKIYKESYDLVNNKFQFDETFSKSKSGDYADSLYRYNISMNTEGVVSVTENIKIKSLQNPLFEQSIVKLSSLKTGAYNRCQNVYASYYGSTGVLNNNSKEQGFNINKYNGEIEFSSVFSNETFIASGYDWELVRESEDNQESMSSTVTLSIEGHGAKNSSQKWTNTINGFSAKQYLLNVSQGAFAYLKSPLGKCRTGSPSYLSKEGSECSYYNGTISVTKQYLDINLQSITTTSYEAPVPQWSFYIKAGGVLKVPHPQNTMGKNSTSVRTFSPNMILSRPTPPSAGNLTESSSRTYDYFNRVIEEKVTNYYH